MNIFKKVILFSILGLSLFGSSVLDAQVISKSIIDLRTKIAHHKWSFHPGDSPVLKDRKQNESDYNHYSEDETDKNKNSVKYAYAAYNLGEYDKGWINDIQIQLSWTRYRTDGKRPFKNFKEYFDMFKGYGWYRTEVAISKSDLKKKFKSSNLFLRLGKIGQADAVYFNGYYIGGTGLTISTPQNKILADKKLKYDKIRYYRIPGEIINYHKKNIIAVRVFAKYNIAPGLSHGKYYISSSRKIERSMFWDNFKKIFIIVLTSLLGMFYLYWQYIFREQDRATIYFSFVAFAMAVNTFMQSQIAYSIWTNALWIKKIEFISFVIFVHMLLEFFVHFTKVETKLVKIIDRVWGLLGLAAIITIAFIPTLVMTRRFFAAWAVIPAFLFIYLIYIMIKGRNIPSMTSMSIGFLGMVILLLNDVLVGFQFRWVVWEFSLKDYAFAFFSFTAAAAIVSNMIKSRDLIEVQKKEKERLSRYFSPDVVGEILKGNIALGGEEKKIVTLFADIVGFTSFSENNPPGKVVDRLNEMFTRISDAIFEYKATLDKYIGDCIMAFWGAPQATELDAYNSIACAMKMQEVMGELAKELPEGESPFQLRIGINYGESIVGNIGSHERMDYTVIGDAVNSASRIESNGIPGKVSVSESTFIAAGGDEFVKYSEIREIQVKGKVEPLKVYVISEVLSRG